MYIPKEFKINGNQEVKRFIQENPLGVLISVAGQEEPLITHLPFLLIQEEGQFKLEAHLAMQNKHAGVLKSNEKATIVFQGPNGYISSSVYEKQNVPTWNYQAVHLHGHVEVFSEKELLTHLEKSVTYFEQHRTHPIQFSKLSTEMISAYLKQIIGFRFIPSRVEAAYKLSQNRSTRDYQAIIDDIPDGKLKTEMKRLKK